MDFVSPLVSLVLPLCDSMAGNISHVVNLNQRISDLTSALNELKAVKDDLKREVDQADLRGVTCSSLAKGWLQQADVAEIRASSIIELLGQRRRCFGCFNTNCSLKYKLSKKVVRMLEEITQLIRKASDVSVTNRLLLFRCDTVEELPSRPIIGLKVMLEQVWQFLAEDEVGMLGIYGMGGVGKTTLLKNINNELLTKSHDYEVVIWVLVSKDFVPEKIQQVIGARLGLSWEQKGSLEERASQLYRIMRRKKFLLLLDDLWEAVDLDKMGIPLPDKDNKCKVIFTTRSMDMCSAMDAQRKLKVEFLGQDESWQLFCSKVGQREILVSPAIRPLAERIVRKCGGLPLALITTARAMANKETEEEWMHAIEVLNRSPSELRGMEDIFTLLKFSYDYLENDLVRACFLYCSLFPEDYSIEKEQLVEYWIGEGFLDGSHDNYAYNRGYSIIGSLKVACLLETGEEITQVKMHDVVRSFAQWIASECGMNKKLIIMEASMGLTQAPQIENWRGALVISLLDNGITVLPDQPVCPNLSTLLLQWNSGLRKIPSRFFQYMPALRVLDLSFTSLRELPASIKYLVELCHLDLSGTKIAALPEEIGSLAKLKQLDLQRTLSLRSIPRDAVSGLSKLEVLNLYYSYEKWELQGLEAEDEVGFADLEGLENLTTLGITLSSLNMLQRLHGFSSLLTCIQYLCIKGCNGLLNLELSSSSNHGKRLRRLSIKDCDDLASIVVGSGAGQDWLPSLEVLALHGLANLTTVWRNPVAKGCLQKLRCIDIWHCHKLKNISWILQLPKLEVIYLFYCREMEELVSSDDILPVKDSKAFLPSLRTLSIRDLPKLRSIAPLAFSFQSLESIAVIDCPKLKKLPLEANSSSTLPTVYGNKEWWDGLEWDEAITRSGFFPQFMLV